MQLHDLYLGCHLPCMSRIWVTSEVMLSIWEVSLPNNIVLSIVLSITILTFAFSKANSESCSSYGEWEWIWMWFSNKYERWVEVAKWASEIQKSKNEIIAYKASPLFHFIQSQHIWIVIMCVWAHLYFQTTRQRRIIFKWMNKFDKFINKATWNDQKINFDEDIQGSRIHHCFGDHASIVSNNFSFLGRCRCYVQWLIPYTLKWGSQHSMSKVAISPTNYHKNIHNKWQ